MKRKIVITKEGRVWLWEIKEGRKVLFGGYCRTKKDATNDAGVVWRQNEDEDNAKLIVAAPALLAALKTALGCVKYYDNHEGAPIALQEVEAALKLCK